MEFDFGTQMVALILLIALGYAATWLYRFAHRTLETYKAAKAGMQEDTQGAQPLDLPDKPLRPVTFRVQGGEGKTLDLGERAKVWTEAHEKIARWLTVEPDLSGREAASRLWGVSGGRKAVEAGEMVRQVKAALLTQGFNARNGNTERVPGSKTRSTGRLAVEEME